MISIPKSNANGRGVDFDDPEYGAKEEGKSAQKVGPGP